ncbi:MAG: hypothetical protein HC884_13710 [Chloroflexaceae bacterium]|nr:hypothetical protein [Chloroflexaceae bacterium]
MGSLWKKPTLLVLSSLVVLIMVALVVGTVAPSTEYGATMVAVARKTEPPARTAEPPARATVAPAGAAGVMVPLIEPDEEERGEEALAIEATEEGETPGETTDETAMAPEVEVIEETVPTTGAVAAAEATEVPTSEVTEEVAATPEVEVIEETIPTTGAVAAAEEAEALTAVSLEERVRETTGPGWTIVSNGDVSGDGNPEVIAYQVADMTLSRTFADPLYRSYPWIVSELLVVQEGETGELEYLLTVTPESLMTYDQKLMTLGVPSSGNYRSPAAFLATYTRDSEVPFTIIPITSAGEPYMQSIGFAWDKEAGEYRLILAVNVPTPAADEASEEPAEEPAHDH